MAKVQQILVYTDFTEIGDKSIQWAVFLANKFSKKILLVHVINENTYNYFDKNNVESEVNNALSEFSMQITKDHNIECDYYSEKGCTCTIINSTAERIDAYMVVLGTHGKNDPQFLSGSAAGKIIRKARIPYFVVQKNSPLPAGNKNIILPVDIQKENKEKTGWVSYFAKHISSLIEIVYFDHDDERLRNNIFFSTKFFNQLDLKYDKKVLGTSSTKSPDPAAVKYAYENNSLMVVIITTKEPTLLHKIFGFPENKIISNSYGVPVLCINPKKDLYIPCI